MRDTWLRIARDVINEKPALTYGNDNARPYWKAYGTGTEKLLIEKELDGGFLIRVLNQAEGTRAGKEAWVHLDAKFAARIGEFLQGKFVPTH